MNYKDTSFHFLVFYQILWILSWQYAIQIENSLPILVQKLFIRWWDKFSSPINLDFRAGWGIPTLPPDLPSTQEITLILTKSVSLSIQKESLPMKSVIESAACPAMLFMSPTLYLQVLQVKEKEPHLTEAEVLDKAQKQLFLPSSPINISQQDIEEVLTTIASSPSSNIRGHGQPLKCHQPHQPYTIFVAVKLVMHPLNALKLPCQHQPHHHQFPHHLI